jgi:hypothetical protein
LPDRAVVGEQHPLRVETQQPVQPRLVAGQWLCRALSPGPPGQFVHGEVRGEVVRLTGRHHGTVGLFDHKGLVARGVPRVRDGGYPRADVNFG